MNISNYLHTKLEKSAFKRFLRPVPTLEEALPYADFFERNGVSFVLLKSSQIGCGLKIRWRHHLTTDDKSLGEFEETLARYLQAHDPTYHVQFQLEKNDGTFSGHVFFTSPRATFPIPLVPRNSARVA